MKDSVNQQIVISGVGGQGVLFITRLLAEAALSRGLDVFTSETHGMAQRGGTVLSFLKVGDFSSPLIRPGKANGILALKAETLAQHGAYLAPGGWAAVNAEKDANIPQAGCVITADADRLAKEIGDLKSINLVMLGAALTGEKDQQAPSLFCEKPDIIDILKIRLKNNTTLRDAAILAVETGYSKRSA